MKVAALFATIAALAILAGAYSTARQHAEREAWRVESSHLLARIADLEGGASPGSASKREPRRQPYRSLEQQPADPAAELAAIEAEILDQRAALVQLKSDRLVADEYVKESLGALRQQIRKTKEIEQGLTALQSRRLEIKGHIVKAEGKIDELARAIEAREDHVASLDRKIAELAIRQETANASLESAEQQKALETAALDDLEAVKEAKPPSAKPVEKAAAGPMRTVAATERLAKAPAGSGAGPRKDRSKGLYQFDTLSIDGNQGGSAGTFKKDVKAAAVADPTVSSRRASDEWASKQYELGRHLVTQGERSSGSRELNEAVLAFRAALGEWPKDRDPLRWAAVQNDLGYALALLGKRKRDVGVLEQAAIACRHALAAIKQDRAPLLWAAAHYNLGLTLSGMAALKSDEVLWQRAIEAYQKSAEVFENADARAEAEMTTRRLQDAHNKLTALRKRS